VVRGLQPVLDVAEQLCHAQVLPASAETIETCGADVSTFAGEYVCVVGSQALGKRIDMLSKITLVEFLITGKDGSG
jgi:hypothetical protein